MERAFKAQNLARHEPECLIGCAAYELSNVFSRVDADLARTNNAVDGFNRRLKASSPALIRTSGASWVFSSASSQSQTFS